MPPSVALPATRPTMAVSTTAPVTTAPVTATADAADDALTFRAADIMLAIATGRRGGWVRGGGGAVIVHRSAFGRYRHPAGPVPREARPAAAGGSGGERDGRFAGFAVKPGAGAGQGRGLHPEENLLERAAGAASCSSAGRHPPSGGGTSLSAPLLGTQALWGARGPGARRAGGRRTGHQAGAAPPRPDRAGGGAAGRPGRAFSLEASLGRAWAWSEAGCGHQHLDVDGWGPGPDDARHVVRRSVRELGEDEQARCWTARR